MPAPKSIKEDIYADFGFKQSDIFGQGRYSDKKSFRVNTLKADIKTVSKRFDCEPVPWCTHGFFTKDDVTASIEHFQGLIYMQEAASMAAALALEPRPHERVLDICAAPGSKTAQIAQIMENMGCIVANEPDAKRAKTLRFNLNRMGVANSIVTRNDGRRIPKRKMFDRVLLDAPCSNMGRAARDKAPIEQFSPARVRKMQKLQISLLESGYGSLRDGGTMVYSTCTFAVDENEAIVDYAIRKLGMQAIRINTPIKATAAATRIKNRIFSREVENSLRIHPKDNGTDGFFMAKLIK